MEKDNNYIELQEENRKLRSINKEIIEGRDKYKALNKENMEELNTLREYKTSSDKIVENKELTKRISSYNIKDKFLEQALSLSGITKETSQKEIDKAMEKVKTEYGEYFETPKAKTDELDFTPLEPKQEEQGYEDVYKEFIEKAKNK